ncbi:MAG: lysophospholipase [Candidatus Bipolaricaulia bacterium]
MKHQEETFAGVRDAEIYCQNWLPDDEPRAALVLVHGLAEHCGRYGNLVDHFVPLGYAVYAHDHIGHGRSGGQRVFVKRFEDLTNVLGMRVDHVRARHPELPIFLVGHSVGALITAVFLLDRQEALDGAVLSGAVVKIPDNISPVAVLASRLLSAVMPRVGIVAVEAEGVSRDPAVVREYMEDPLVYKGKTTARMGAEMLKAMQRTTREAGKITIPLLILHGSEDKLADPDGARMLREAAGSTDKVLKIYPGLHHEIYNEPEHAEVLTDVETWLAAHLSSW